MAIVNCLAIETNFYEKKISVPIWSGRLKGGESLSHFPHSWVCFYFPITSQQHSRAFCNAGPIKSYQLKST